jgi:hypothetical protein
MLRAVVTQIPVAVEAEDHAAVAQQAGLADIAKSAQRAEPYVEGA